jgi:hypothetical protein
MCKINEEKDEEAKKKNYLSMREYHYSNLLRVKNVAT